MTKNILAVLAPEKHIFVVVHSCVFCALQSICLQLYILHVVCNYSLLF